MFSVLFKTNISLCERLKYYGIMQNHFKINRPILDIITSSAIQYEPHSINVFAVEFFCIFGVQKFPSLKICLNKFPLIKWGYNRNCIIKLKRIVLDFITDMVKLSSSSCTLYLLCKSQLFTPSQSGENGKIV